MCTTGLCGIHMRPGSQKRAKTNTLPPLPLAIESLTYTGILNAGYLQRHSRSCDLLHPPWTAVDAPSRRSDAHRPCALVEGGITEDQIDQNNIKLIVPFNNA